MRHAKYAIIIIRAGVATLRSFRPGGITQKMVRNVKLKIRSPSDNGMCASASDESSAEPAPSGSTLVRGATPCSLEAPRAAEVAIPARTTCEDVGGVLSTAAFVRDSSPHRAVVLWQGNAVIGGVREAVRRGAGDAVPGAESDTVSSEEYNADSGGERSAATCWDDTRIFCVPMKLGENDAVAIWFGRACAPSPAPANALTGVEATVESRDDDPGEDGALSSK